MTMAESKSGGQGGMTIKGLTKTFRPKSGPVVALDGVDMVVEPGEFVTLIGPSGCGKSTLFNIVAGLEMFDSGRIRLDGAMSHDRLGEIAYMFQKDLLFPWRTVVGNAILGLEMDGLSRTEARNRVEPYLERFGLADFGSAYPDQLSGGMRQRVAFLRTMVQERSIMLLDEPFGALDSYTRTNLQQWLMGVWEEIRTTVLFVTHDVAEAVYLSDRVYVMTPRPGRIQAVYDIELSRPREKGIEVTDEFLQLERTLKAELHLHGTDGS